MKCLRRVAILAGLLVAVFSADSSGANSKFINVQGKLTDASGSPLTGSQTVTFRLYTSSTDAVGSAIWIESRQVTLSTGLFNLTLGIVTALDSLSFNQLYYLGIQVAGDADELSPRQQLGASAYAQGSLGDFYVGTSLVVGSSVTVGGALAVGSSVTATTASFNTLTVSSSVAVGTTTVNGNLTIGGAVNGSGDLSIGGTVNGSGDLNIGGQGIVAGTMTVGGNAFSVGGSTFSIAAGTVSVGGLLKPSSAGIQWADGSVSTTAFRATKLVWAVVATTVAAGDSSIGFTGLAPDDSYQLLITLDGSSLNNLRVRFNDDTATNYSYQIFGYYNSSAHQANHTLQSYILVHWISGTAGAPYRGVHYFGTDPDDSTAVLMHGQLTGHGGNGGEFNDILAAKYDGSSALSSIKIYPDSGSISGTVRLLKLAALD